MTNATASRIAIKKTYATTSRVTWFEKLSLGGASPVSANGNHVDAGMGVKCCVGYGEPNHSGAWMTTVIRGQPWWAWISADDLIPLDRAEAKGIAPHFLP